MRKVVLAMITTLNGRLDDPGAWLSAPSEEIDVEFERVYATFDTVLLGHTTYHEMAGYWPHAETNPDVSDVNKKLAQKLNTNKKFVFSKSKAEKPLEWNNAELVLAPGDEDLIKFIKDLKAQSGGNIHLAGGARFAQSMIRLGLVDEYHFYVYPIVSSGLVWFEQLENKLELDLISTTSYDKGAVALYYKSKNG